MVMAPRKLTINDYEITREGAVINKITGRTLKPQPNSKGYLRVHIDGKLRFVHRLVAEKYIPNPNNLEQVNHIDGNKENNSVENLEWISNLENRHHAVVTGLHKSGEEIKTAKLNWEDVDFIRSHSEISNTELAEKYGVSPSTIGDVKHFRTWKTRNTKNS